MLIDHTFIEESHLYRVPGEFVLATSDVIELNGMSDFSQVPTSHLVHAGHRGSATHLAILACETGGDIEGVVSGYEKEHGVKVFDEVMERMQGYYHFKTMHKIKLAGEMEKSRVYRHVGTEALIGATPDMPCFIDGVLTVLDPKTCHKQYGEKLKQLKLKWMAQTHSYTEALEADDDFWRKIKRPDCIQKAVLHLHPECGKKNGFRATGWEFHQFAMDAQYLWDSMIRVARCKLASGYKLQSMAPKADVLVMKARSNEVVELDEVPF